MTVVAAYCRTTCLSCKLAMVSFLYDAPEAALRAASPGGSQRFGSAQQRSFDARRGDAGRDVLLQEGEHDSDGQQRHDCHREQVMPLRGQFALEGIERELKGKVL